jgi:beta-galactosidase
MHGDISRRGFLSGALAGAMAPQIVPGSLLSRADAHPAHAGLRGRRRRINFDRGWRFYKGDDKQAKAPAYDESDWRTLDLPHDWTIEGPYDKDDPSAARGGYLPCGIGWYRKTFRLTPAWQGKKVFIEFDGIYMNSDVWINGQHLGHRPYGYISFRYDLTPHLRRDGDNVLAVRVDNSLQPSSRWYSGSGIYRHVWLTATDPLHVPYHGTFVQTPQVNDQRAKVDMQTDLRNDHNTTVDVKLVNTVIDGVGQRIASRTTPFRIASATSHHCYQSLDIPTPQLWSIENPTRYCMVSEVYAGDELVDVYETPFGVRELHFDAQRGFFLNGENLILKGVCNHHDLGPLGAALWDQALKRRLHMLKAMGCNAIRTGHAPPSPQLLTLCDRMGLLVVDETFDEWREGWAFEDGRLVCGQDQKGKVKYGYHLYFDKWAEKDLKDHLRRDRNHPCVIMWGIGNEVPEAQPHGELETVKRLRDICHALDPTRPITVGCNQMSEVNKTGFAELLDVVGYNGGGGSCFLYEEDHQRYPHRKIYASEVPHTFQTRGEYRTQSRYRNSEHQPPHLSEDEIFTETHREYESSYDNAGVRICARDSWRLTRDLPYIAGEFRWTGFDYLGESGGWPRVLGNFGIIDICNFPKDTYFFYQSRWTDQPMVHLLPHWTWPGKEGTAIPVWCYTNCESVELILNGESLGTERFTDAAQMHLAWDVAYQPGELKAVARNHGEIVATTVKHTADTPARLTLTTDQSSLVAGRGDLAFVTITVQDQHGRFHPTADTAVELQLEGPARLLAVGNGDPMNHQSFQAHRTRAFNGLCRAILAPTDEPGEISIKARADDLAGGDVTLRSVAARRTG